MNCWQKVCQKSSEGFFLGMCHAGIEEYVFFVNSGSFVRYGINKEKAFERIRALSQKYCLNLEELSAIERYLNFYNNKRYQQRLKCMTPMEFHRAAA